MCENMDLEECYEYISNITSNVLQSQNQTVKKNNEWLENVLKTTVNNDKIAEGGLLFILIFTFKM